MPLVSWAEMDELRFRLVTGSDPELFQERLNRAVAELPEGAVLVDVKFAVAGEGSRAVYAALLYFKKVERWED